jgi:hypothetical protein
MSKFTGNSLMSTLLKYASIVALVTGMQLATSGATLAATQPQSLQSAPEKTQSSLKGSTYVPPDDIGGPDQSQGSGTR